MRLVSGILGTALVVLLCLNWAAVAADRDDSLPMIMYEDPEVTVPPVRRVFHDRLKPLWLQALARPETDLKRLAAETIARAHQRGMPGLEDTADELLKTLAQPDEHRAVKIAAARALIALDHRPGAETLFQQATEGGVDLAQLVEPALARWDYEPIRDVWLKRLTNPETSRRRQHLAIAGVGAVREMRAVPLLRELALSPETPADIRLEAARVLGRLQAEGLEEAARPLSDHESGAKRVDRLVAAALLAKHSGKAAEALLLKLAVDPEPAVAVGALGRLFEIDPELIMPLIEHCLANRDARVRRAAARTLHARPTPERIARLGIVLDDVHPHVRRDARRFLIELAQEAEFDAAVRQAATDMLAGESWRGLEQAALVLAAVDHEPAAERLIALLDFLRPEVCIAAAFALERLQVRDTLPALLEKARRSTPILKNGAPAPVDLSGDPFSLDDVDAMMCHIFQAFGLMQFREADPLLRQYIPKEGYFCHARAAAIWALGKIYSGQPESELIAAFSGRLTDYDPLKLEDDRVRRMAAVSLGRLGSKQGLPALRTAYKRDTPHTHIGASAAWAIERITGETLPTPEPHTNTVMGWFLEPVE